MTSPTTTLKPITMEQAEEALLDTGLLYVINHCVLHPMGLAIAMEFSDEAPDAHPTRILLLGTTHGKKHFDTAVGYSPENLAEAKAKLAAFLDRLAEQNITPTNIDWLRVVAETE